MIRNTGGTTLYTQHYIDGIEYKDAGIEAIYHDEGRFYNASGTYRREYYIRDHLGNVRIAFSDLNNNGVIATPGEILQETHYDPFGWRLEGAYMNNAAPDNMYQYNEKENNTDHGLNLLDYGARWYNPVVGRFSGVDPLSDKFGWVSTYNYAENDPVANVDLWGLQKVSAGIASDLRLLEVTRQAAENTISSFGKAIDYLGGKINGFMNAYFPEGTPPTSSYQSSEHKIGSGFETMTTQSSNANGTLQSSQSEKASSLLIVDEMLFPNGNGALDYSLEEGPYAVRIFNGIRQSAEHIDRVDAFKDLLPLDQKGIDTIRDNTGVPIAVRETVIPSEHAIIRPIVKEDDENN